MEKKFKCQSCDNIFMADTSKYVTCPKCGSDNVSFANSNSSVTKYILIGLGAVVVIGLIVWGIIFLTNSSKEDSYTGGSEYTEQVESGEISGDQGIIVEEAPAILPKQISFGMVGKPVYDAKAKSYSLIVKAKIEPADDQKIIYEILTKTGEVIQTNETGSFIGVPPITDVNNQDGIYVIKAYSEDKQYEIEKDVPGFVSVKTESVPKLTVAQVQSIINNKTSAAGIAQNVSLAKPCSARCVNMQGSELPKSLDKMIEAFDMELYRFEVVSLDYDESGRVKRVNYKAFEI